MSEQPMSHDEALDLAAAYVLGALERPEEAAVRAHLETCGLPHPEFEELGAVVPALLELDETQFVEPPSSLRDRIMAAAAADLATRQPAAEPTIPFPSAAERTLRPE